MFSNTDEKTPAVTALDNAADTYEALQEARDQALATLQRAIRAADAEGAISRAEIIRRSKVARQTVYDALAEEEPAEADPAQAS